MTTTALAPTANEEQAASAIELAAIEGDLSKLSSSQRVAYYLRVCESVGLNPITRPFQYLKLNGKLTLYATKDAAAQIRQNHSISIYSIETKIDSSAGIVTVTVKGRNGNGREDCDLGIVSISGLKGDPLCNAILKAVTKAKRRLSLSLGGLGYLDETELETVPSAKPVDVELLDEQQAPSQTAEPPPEPVDLSNLIAHTDVEMKRVGWGPKDGRKCLQEMFGKSSRQQLAIEELEQFLIYLKSLPTAMAKEPASV